MSNRKLPPQLVSLIHHIALNEAGWWDKTIQRFIISFLWLKGDANTLNNIKKGLKKEFNLNLEAEVLKREISKLIEQDVLIEVNEDTYKLSEEQLNKYEEDLEEFETQEDKAKNGFFKLLEIHCPSIDKNECWNSFLDELLIPLVHELGAKTYELISGQSASVDQMTKFQNYLNNFKENKDGIREVITSFFDPKNIIYRNFILRKINAYFCLEAGNLSNTSLQKLTELTKKNVNFTLFLDTNFLFSILGLHENPSNEAAVSLKKLIGNIGNKINAKLYIVPPTVNEAINVLGYHVDKLKGIRFTKNVLNGTKNQNFSGFAEKFINDVRKAGKNINPEEYFEPYLKNLVATVRPQGVELYNQKLEDYSTDQRVIDDLTDRLDYEERVYKDGAKNYEQLLHDITLWHFCKDKRPELVESPIDAGYWIVTVDFRFLGFDAYKRREGNNRSNQICIHPASLIQMLQFWVPRTPEFEEAIINNIRTPFLLNDFNIESEKITLKILETLSRFEDLEDLTEDTISDILLNGALRNKIGSVKDVEDQIDLVKDAIIEQNKLAQEEVKKEKERAELLEKDISKKDSQIDNLEKQISEIEDQKKKEQVRSRDLEERIEQIEKTKLFESGLENYENEKKEFIEEEWDNYRKNKNAFWYFLLVLIIGVVGIILLDFYFFPESTLKKFSIGGGYFLLTLILSFFNREKIKNSCRLIFKRKKTEESEKQKYQSIFVQKNRKPTIEDY